MLTFRFSLNQQSCQSLDFAGIDRCKRPLVKHFDSRDIKIPDSDDCSGSFCHIPEIDHRIRLHSRYLEGRHRDFAQECQRAFGADHQMEDDIKRICKCNQRKKVQTSDILYRILMSDTFHELRISKHIITKTLNFSYYIWMSLCKGFPAGIVSRIKYGSVCKNQTSGQQDPVTVCMNTAAHARSIVHYDTTNHATLDGSRVRTEFSSIRSKVLIHLRTDHSGLKSNCICMITNGISFPVLTRYDEHRVTHSLS